jgi:hypothetical protein
MYTKNIQSETESKQLNTAYDDLSPKAKKILAYIWENSNNSLLFCRSMQESARGEKHSALIEVERYLINE